MPEWTDLSDEQRATFVMEAKLALLGGTPASVAHEMYNAFLRLFERRFPR